MARVITVGVPFLDRTWELDEIPLQPIKVLAQGYRETGGGMAATAAVAIAALGGDALFWGRVGDDATGATLLERLRSRGVDVGDMRTIAGGLTPTSAVLVDRFGERLLAAFRGEGLEPDPSWLPLAKIGAAGAVLADIRWPEGAQAALAAARAAGRARVLDADGGDPQAIARLLPLCDHVIFSAKGLVEYADVVDPRRALAAVRAQVHGLVAVTLGAEGCLWCLDGEPVHTPALPVHARDTTGAGDTFHGAYALALAEGRDPAFAIRFACAAAALKCERGGGWDGMPAREAVRALLGGA